MPVWFLVDQWASERVVGWNMETRGGGAAGKTGQAAEVVGQGMEIREDGCCLGNCFTHNLDN